MATNTTTNHAHQATTQHTTHTAEKRGTSHKAQWWCVVGEALTCLSIHLTTTTRRRGRGKDRGVGSRDRKKGGGTKTSGCWWWWRDGHWWHHTHSLKRRKHCAHPPSPTLTHRQEKDRDKEKDRTRQRTRSGRWVWLCMKRRRKQVGWWVTTSHKSTQGKAKQPSLTPFLSSTPPFPLPFSPFSFYSFSPLHNGLYRFKTKKHSQLLFPFFSLKNTLTKRKTK